MRAASLQVGEVEAELAEALSTATKPQDAYRASPPLERRLLNQTSSSASSSGKTVR
jgi:hypothetical protein